MLWPHVAWNATSYNDLHQELRRLQRGMIGVTPCLIPCMLIFLFVGGLVLVAWIVTEIVDRMLKRVADER